jgi:RNA polymerase primary sigma factor
MGHFNQIGESSLKNARNNYSQNRYSKENDIVKLYLKDATKEKLLTRNEEIEYFKNYSHRRTLYYHAILNSDFVISHILKVLENVATKTVPIGHHIALKSNYLSAFQNPVSKDNTYAMLNMHIKTIRKLLDRNRISFIKCISRSTTKENKRKAVEEILSRKKKAIELILELRPKEQVIINAYKNLLDYHSKFDLTKFNKKNLLEYALHTQSSPKLVNKYIEQCEKQKELLKSSKDSIIMSNARLVINIAKKYRNKGLEFTDLISEGNIGLIKAVDKFSLSHGTKFSTYAVWWIRQTIFRSISEKSRTIVIADHAVVSLNKIKATMNNFLLENGREPTNLEIAKRFNIGVNVVNNLLQYRRGPISLDSPISGSNRTIASSLANQQDPDFELLDAYDFTQLGQDIKYVLTKLNSREREIIKLRYGLNESSQPHTLQQVADILGVTRERIRQIEKKIMNKLRRKELGDYLE